MATKQEQVAPEETVRELAPGILRFQLPVEMPGLGHVNAYALLDGQGAGATLVDAGVPGDRSWQTLRHRLKDAGLSAGAIHTVVLTHSHPDHYGGAHRLAGEHGATVVTHGAWRTRLWPEHAGDPAGDPPATPSGPRPRLHVPDIDVTDLPSANPWETPVPWGGQSMAAGWRRHRAEAPPEPRPMDWLAPEPARVVADGDRIAAGGREWVCLSTPGHTLDHLCLHDPDGGILLAGDHVLPTITPHISGVGGGPDPLAAFVSSLERVAALDGVRLVLPAHGQPITDLPGRVAAIERHHRDRLDRLAAISAALGPATVAELSHELFRPDHWGPMAESEAYAHLEHLRLGGGAERWRDGDRLLYRVEARPASAAR